ncbi:hypothetical protein Tco_0151530 [Tanacetum coccineum]
MLVYIQRQINNDLQFAARVRHLWEVLYSRVNEHKLLIAELNVFGGLLALQCAKFFKQLSQTEMLKMLEIRKSIAEVHMQVHKKIDFIIVMSDFVLLDPRLQSKKSAIDSSFTLGSPEEADYVKILQSCNGLLLCCGSGSPVFYYVYNPSTNLYKKLPYPDCSLDNSPYYSSAGLRITFDPTKSPYYKLVDVGRTFCDIDIQIYSSETGKWSLCKDHFTTLVLIILIVQYIGMMGYRVHTDDFMTPLPEGWSIRPNVGIIVLGEKEQDSFLVIKLFEKVVQYNLISKTLYEIYDCGSNQLDDNHDDNDDDDDDDDELLQQFQPEHNVYEFIPSFASVDSVLGVVGARCFDLDLGVLVKSELQVSSELDLKVSSELSSEVTQKDYDQSFHQK